jgi:hypothetical protein
MAAGPGTGPKSTLSTPNFRAVRGKPPRFSKIWGDLLMDHGLQTVKMPETIELSCPHLSRTCRTAVPLELHDFSMKNGRYEDRPGDVL